MLPLLGVTHCYPTPHSKIADISGSYERISTKFSAICLLTKVMIEYDVKKCSNMLNPPGATPPPILKNFISLANRETKKAKDENMNHS